MKKIDARKLNTQAQQLLWNQAIRLRKAGRKYKEIAEITGVNETTVCKWYKAYLHVNVSI
ncbi:MAG: helix-turn-helix domain-containing protein [Desulfobacteraceae bacterium]|jgi:transposase